MSFAEDFYKKVIKKFHQHRLDNNNFENPSQPILAIEKKSIFDDIPDLPLPKELLRGLVSFKDVKDKVIEETLDFFKTFRKHYNNNHTFSDNFQNGFSTCLVTPCNFFFISNSSFEDLREIRTEEIKTERIKSLIDTTISNIRIFNPFNKNAKSE